MLLLAGPIAASMKSCQVLMGVVIDGVVVDPSGRAPVLRHAVLVPGVEGLIRVQRVDVLEVRELGHVELFEQTLLHHLGDVRAGWDDHVVAGGTLGGGELLDGLLVRVVDVGRDVAPGADDVGVVVLRPRVEVDAATASAAAAPAAAAPAAAAPAAAAPAAAAAARGQECRANRGARGEPEEPASAQRLGDPLGGVPRDQDPSGVVDCVPWVLLLVGVQVPAGTMTSIGSVASTSSAWSCGKS